MKKSRTTQKKNSFLRSLRGADCLLAVFATIAIGAATYTIASGQEITTFAGTGMLGFSGDGGQATAAKFHNPSNARTDSHGNVYIVDYNNYRIRKVDAAGVVSTVAGHYLEYNNGDGGQATAAGIATPLTVAIDNSGDMYISEIGESSYFLDSFGGYHIVYQSWVRMVNTAGIITTIAGNGALGVDSGMGGPATAARFQFISDVIPDNSGNIYIADYSNMIWKVNAAGIITNVAGNGIASDNGDGGPASAAGLNGPQGLALDASGNLYITEAGGNNIREINAAGIISTIAGNGAHNYYGDGGPATDAELASPQAAAFDNAGNLYIADNGNDVIRVVNSAGIINTYAGSGIPGSSGDGGPALDAEFTDITGVTADGAGNVYVVDYDSDKVRIISRAVNTGISPLHQQVDIIDIYPNPATTSLTILSTHPSPAVALAKEGIINQITITNLVGQTVFTCNYNSGQVQVDVSTLPIGLYFVKINGNEVRKFVKE